MTDLFASTAAQILPVLGFAGVIEFRAILNHPLRLSKDPDPPHVAVTSHVIALVIWAAIIAAIVRAEALCLDHLRGMPVPSDADNTVQTAVIASLILLVVMPVVGVPASWAIRLFRIIRQHSPLYRRHFHDSE